MSSFSKKKEMLSLWRKRNKTLRDVLLEENDQLQGAKRSSGRAGRRFTALRYNGERRGTRGCFPHARIMEWLVFGKVTRVFPTVVEVSGLSSSVSSS